MKFSSIISQVRAAQRLSIAFEAGYAPAKADFNTLNLPTRLGSQFKR